jgi:hypothetical protein
VKKYKMELLFSSFAGRTDVWVTVKICVIIFGLLALFFDDVALIFSEAFQNVTTTCVVVVPFALGYRVYRKRKMLKAIFYINSECQLKRFEYLSSMIGALLVLTGVLLYWYGSYTFVPLAFHMLALPPFAAGLILFLFGPKTLRMWVFPIILLFFMIPPPSAVFAGVWILMIIGFFVAMFRIEKIVEPRLTLHKFAKCSRWHSIAVRGSRFCAQCGRVIGLERVVSINEKFKVIAVIAGVLLLLTFQVPFLVIAQTSDVVITNSPMGRQEPLKPLPEVQGYTLQFSYRDNEFEERSNVDMAVAYVYTLQEESSKRIWVSVEAASEVYRLHQWETDLITTPLNQNQPLRVVQHESESVLLSESPVTTGHSFAFHYIATGQKQVVLYWYDEARFATNSTSELKNVGISLIVYPSDWEELPEVETQLKTLATKIVDYWQPLKMSSPINIAINQNGAQFAGATLILTLALLVFYFFELKRQKGIAERVYEKLSSANKDIVNVVKHSQNRTGSMLSTIANHYRKDTSEEVGSDHLLRKLEKLEKVGIIKSEIAYINDEPVLVWKTLL